MSRAMLLGAGAALVLAGVAAAQAPQGPGSRMGDADGDGKLSQAEMVQAERARFARLDTNRDGKVTTQEMEGLAEQRMDAMFERLDADRNGSISREEFAARKGGGHWRGERRGGGRGLAWLDADGDGVVTQAEADAKAQARFAAMDKNKDGFVTKDERPGKMGRHGPRPGGEAR